MRITEELRRVAAKTECANGRCGKLYRGDLDHIADRIEEELANYIELPKDADGVTIHIGDEVEVIGYEDGTVAALQLDERRWSVAVRPHGWDTPTAYDAEIIRHAKPDSWERIIEDALHWEGSDVPFAECHMTYELVERCKRLAGEAK